MTTNHATRTTNTPDQTSIELMRRRGAEHAQAGKRCTPYDCQEVDRELFAAAKSHPRPAQWYADMRGAFNLGWEAEHHRMVSE